MRGGPGAGLRGKVGERHGAARVHGRGERPRSLGAQGAGEVQSADGEKEDGEALPGADGVPVCGDEQQDAAREQHAPERQSLPTR